jgi:hypothetical protein
MKFVLGLLNLVEFWILDFKFYVVYGAVKFVEIAGTA